MAIARESIDVLVPIDRVYAAWTDYKSYPRFMTAVGEVRHIDDDTYGWYVTVAGVTHEFKVRITEEKPGELITWESADGAGHSGRVTFEEIEVVDPRSIPGDARPDHHPQGAGGLTGGVSASVATVGDSTEEEVMPRGRQATRITVYMEWEDHTLIQKLGDKFGLDDRRVRRELVHFKKHVEKAEEHQ